MSEREGGGKEGSGRKGKLVMHRRRKKKTHGLLVGRFSVSLKKNFIFLSLPLNLYF